MSSFQHNPGLVKSIRNFIAAAVVPAFLLIVSLTSGGCGVYSNLTTYFNTYYNAEHLFQDAVTEMTKSQQKDRDTNYFARWSVPASTQGKFDSVVAKCSKIIQFHNKSKYVDDAMMMIGEAYAYQNDAESALRTFKELITTFPESDLRFQARLWQAKTLYYDKKYDEAVTVAHQSAQESEEHDEKEVLIEALMLQAQVAMDRKEFDLAASWYEKAVQPNDADQLRLIAAFQLGAVYDSLGKPDKAAKAYKSVREYGPDFATRFKADYRYGVMLEELGDYKTALKLFDDLKYDATKPEDKGLLDLELAKTYTLLGDTARAFDFYRYIDTVYRSQISTEKANFERGKLYETQYHDLRTAADYYKRTQGTNFNTPEGNLGRQKSIVLGHYVNVLNNLALYDSLLHPERYARAIDSTDSLHVRTMGDSTMMAGTDSLHGGHQIPGSSIASSTAPADSQQHDLLPGGNMGNDHSGTQNPPPQGNPSNPSLANLPPGSSPQGNPNFPPQHGLISPRGDQREKGGIRGNDAPPQNGSVAPPPQGAGDKLASSDDDEVERDRVTGRNHEIDDQIHKGRGAPRSSFVDSTEGKPLPPGMKSFTKPSMAGLSPDTLRKLMCRGRFELAGIFYLELNMPDSAERLYRQIAEDSTETPLRPAAMYALSEIQRSRGDSVSADSLGDRVIDRYNKTEYAKKFKVRKGMDTAGVVDKRWVQYRLAMDSLQNGNYKETLQMLVSLYADTSDTSAIAAKSLYTSGWVLENIAANNDSAAGLYKQLIHRFPNSEYTLVAQPKVAVKDDPKSLSQFVKVKEIGAVAKPVKKHGKQAGNEGVKSGENADEQDDVEHDEELIRSRTPDRDVNDDGTDDTDTSSDDDNN